MMLSIPVLSIKEPWLELILDGTKPSEPDAVPMSRVGKKAAGRLLHGRTWDEMPEVSNARP